MDRVRNTGGRNTLNGILRKRDCSEDEVALHMDPGYALCGLREGDRWLQKEGRVRYHLLWQSSSKKAPLSKTMTASCGTAALLTSRKRLRRRVHAPGAGSPAKEGHGAMSEDSRAARGAALLYLIYRERKLPLNSSKFPATSEARISSVSLVRKRILCALASIGPSISPASKRWCR